MMCGYDKTVQGVAGVISGGEFVNKVKKNEVDLSTTRGPGSSMEGSAYGRVKGEGRYPPGYVPSVNHLYERLEEADRTVALLKCAIEAFQADKLSAEGMLRVQATLRLLGYSV